MIVKIYLVAESDLMLFRFGARYNRLNMLRSVNKIPVDCAFKIHIPCPALPNCKTIVIIMPPIAAIKADVVLVRLEKSPNNNGPVKDTDINA